MDTIATVIIDEEDDSQKAELPLSKKQRNDVRKQANKKWKTMDRKVGSGVDPNPRHTKYYQLQLPELRDATEWDRFQRALVDPLCVTFRLGSCCPQVVQNSIISRMSKEFKTLSGRFFELNGSVIRDNIVKVIEWVRASMLVWQLIVDSTTLARDSSLSTISNYLRREVALGHIVRQEMASMLPALLLDVKSHHTVLDICSAPGSKTEQLLYLMQRDFQLSRKKNADNSSLNEIMSGVVVANDADPVRIETLRKRYHRCALLRDGTIRKFPHVWRLFRPRMALELHSIQLQIAIASVMMLKPGGRIVYSTCSINPIEDEAVVAGLLRHFNGKLRLVQSTLPGLISRPGVTTWEVSKDTFAIGEPDEKSKRESIARLVPLTASMYPPSPAEVASGEYPLQYCHRILPHDQDMGGFFVAVLELTNDEAVLATVKSSGIITISEEESMATMKRLGYNPASLSKPAAKTNNNKKSKKGDQSSSLDSGSIESIAYEPFEYRNEFGLAVNNETIYVMQSETSKYIKPMSDPEEEGDELDNTEKPKPEKRVAETSNCIFGSKKDGWLKKPTAQVEAIRESISEPEKHHFISLMSTGVIAALDSWAHEPGLVRQAGVEIGKLNLCTGSLQFHGDNARCAINCFDDTAQSIVKVPRSIFTHLCESAIAVSGPEYIVRGLEDDVEAMLIHYSQCARKRLKKLKTLFVVVHEMCHSEANEVESASPEPAVEQSVLGKRRLSKAERKKLKCGNDSGNLQSDPVRSNNSSVGSDISTPLINFSSLYEGMILLVSYNKEYDCFVFGTELDVCQSYLSALK